MRAYSAFRREVMVGRERERITGRERTMVERDEVSLGMGQSVWERKEKRVLSLGREMMRTWEMKYWKGPEIRTIMGEPLDALGILGMYGGTI